MTQRAGDRTASPAVRRSDQERSEPSIALPASDDHVVQVAIVLLTGYLVIGRAFAQIGLPSASVFLGEVIIVAMLMIPSIRTMMVRSLQWLVRPGPLHVQTWAVVMFIGYGLLMVVGGLLAGYDPLEAAKNFAFNYYAVMMLAGLAIGTRDPDFLRRLARVLPWVNVAYIVVFPVVLRGSQLQLPFSAVEDLTTGAGTIVSLALIVCFDPAPSRRWYLIGLNLFCLAFLQVRGDWLAVTLGLGLWATLMRKWRVMIAVGAAGLLGLALVAALDVTIPTAGDRGGAVSADEIFARAVAPFDEELAARYSDDAENFAGTTVWRRRWWNEIWVAAHSTDSRAMLGHGYGFELFSLADFIAAEETVIRTPHNVFYYTLGFTGWVGVAIFATLHGAILAALVRVYRRGGSPFGLILWVMATASGSFGNFFETPYNAAPYWFLIGLSLAPLLKARVTERPAVVGRQA
jgi:hypothetical protein